MCLSAFAIVVQKIAKPKKSLMLCANVSPCFFGVLVPMCLFAFVCRCPKIAKRQTDAECYCAIGVHHRAFGVRSFI